MVKKVLFLALLCAVITSALFGMRVTHAVEYDNSVFLANGSRLAYTQNGILYVQDEASGKKTKLTVVPEEMYGLAVDLTSDAVYWLKRNEIDADIMKFTFANDTTSMVLDTASVVNSGEIVQEFKMLNDYIVWYQINNKDKQTYVYDMKLNKKYGVKGDEPFDFEDKVKWEDGRFEFVRMNANEVFHTPVVTKDGASSYLRDSLSVPILLGTQKVLFVITNASYTGTSYEFRVRDLQTGVVSLAGTATSIPDDMRDVRLGTQYGVVYSMNKEDGTITYKRMDYATGQMGKTIMQNQGIIQAISHDGSTLIWTANGSSGPDYMYRADIDTTCKLSLLESLPTFKTSRANSEKFIFWMGTDGTTRNIPLACVSGTQTSPSNNSDIIPTDSVSAGGGSLIKTASRSAVYYLGSDNKRYVFPSPSVFSTWYTNFLGTSVISDDAMADIVIGGNVTYRPGMRLVKITSDPKVYAVGKNGTLRHITSSAIAIQLYGLNWDDVLRDIPDFLFVNYKIGNPINKASDFVVSSVKDSAKSINEDKGL